MVSRLTLAGGVSTASRLAAGLRSLWVEPAFANQRRPVVFDVLPRAAFAPPRGFFAAAIAAVRFAGATVAAGRFGAVFAGVVARFAGRFAAGRERLSVPLAVTAFHALSA